MRIYLSIFFSLFLLAASAHAQTNNQGTRFFPPDNCVPGQMNILTWDGGSVTRCEQVPTCTSPAHLEFNGHNFQCATDSTCPIAPIVDCAPGYHTVDGGRDDKGCLLPAQCVKDDPRPNCPLYQIPLCPAGEHVVSDPVGPDGCQGGPRCVKDDPKKCVPQPECPDTRVLDCAGTVIGAKECITQARSCDAATVQWSQGNDKCSGSIFIDGAVNQTVDVVAPGATDDNAGKAEFKCVDPCSPNGGNTTCMAMPFWQAQPGATCASFGKKPICPVYQMGICAPGTHLVGGPIGNDGCPRAPKCMPDNSNPNCVDAYSECNPGYHEAGIQKDAGGCNILRCDKDTVKPICPMILNQACAPGSHFIEGPTGNDGCPTGGHCEKDIPHDVVCSNPALFCAPGYHGVPNSGKDANGCDLPGTCEKDTTVVTTVTPPGKPFCGGISTQCARGFHEAWDNGKQANGCPMPAKCVKN